MNQDPENNSNATRPGDAGDMRRIERLLADTRPRPIDNTRIKLLVREKIMREKMRRRSVIRRRSALALSAAACIAIIVTIGSHLMPSHTPLDLSEATLAQVRAASYTELNVAPGQREEIILPDGSCLIANSGTRVLYPETFNGPERRIYASGEVCLHVTKDPSHPFIVESDRFDVKVLGTTFNITNTSDSTASVVLVEGSVEITCDHSSHATRISPNDKADITNGAVSAVTTVDASDYTAWTKGLLALRGQRLGDLVRHLSSHYGIDIQCDPSLSDSRIYGKLDLRDSVSQALDLIRQIIPMEITVHDGRISLKATTMK